MRYVVDMDKRPSDYVARTIRERRDHLGWSAKRLAEECARLGAPELTSAVIANIEHGRPDKDGRRRRDVTVDELLVLSYALAVPPLLLLVPLGDEDEFPIVPTVTVHPHLAWRVITGEEPLVTSERFATRLKDWHPAAATIRLHDQLRETQAAVERTHTELKFAQMEQDEARQNRARPPYVKALERMAQSLDSIVEAGLRPPPLHPEVVADLQATGAVKHPEALRARDLLDWEKDDDGKR